MVCNVFSKVKLYVGLYKLNAKQWAQWQRESTPLFVLQCPLVQPAFLFSTVAELALNSAGVMPKVTFQPRTLADRHLGCSNVAIVFYWRIGAAFHGAKLSLLPRTADLGGHLSVRGAKVATLMGRKQQAVRS
jgi:hypothetical protein